MNKFWVLVFIVMLLGITGCRKDEVNPSATIMPENAISRSITVVQLTELATNPESFENWRVQVSGRYGMLPKPSCSAVLYLSPATWVLGEAGVIIRASGLEEIILPLAPDDLALQVIGRWRRWDGLIGCGDSAVTSTIWYLEVDRILWPNPLSRATLTPFGWVDQPIETVDMTGLTTSITSDVTQTMLSPTESSPQQETPTPSPTTRTLPSPTLTPSPLPIASPTTLSSPLATPSPTSLVSPLDASINDSPPTSTPWPTYTPLPNVTVNTPTPTVTPSSTPGVINKGVLEFDKVLHGNLDSNQTHQWKFTGLTGGVITLTVASYYDLDIEIILINPEGTRVARQGDKLAGETETIGGQILTIHGDYSVQIKELDGISGNYALILMDISSPRVSFPGNLKYGDDENIELPANVTHIWHFMGEAGDNVTFYLDPDDEADCVLQIYRPGGINALLVEQDSGEEGGREEMTIQLDETGFYSILVKEYYGNRGSYILGIASD